MFTRSCSAHASFGRGAIGVRSVTCQWTSGSLCTVKMTTNGFTPNGYQIEVMAMHSKSISNVGEFQAPPLQSMTWRCKGEVEGKSKWKDIDLEAKMATDHEMPGPWP